MAQTLNNHHLVAKAPPSCISSKGGGRSTVGRERDAVVVGHCHCCLSVVVVVVVAHCCCCLYGVRRVYGSIYSLVDLIKKGNKKKIPVQFSLGNVCDVASYIFRKMPRGLSLIVINDQQRVNKHHHW